MRRLAILFAGLLLQTSSAADARPQAGAPPPTARPNIVWISNEDMSPHIGVYGDKFARTPVLDRL